MKRKANDRERIAKALGASRVVEVQAISHQGPLGLLSLREEIAHRLQSTGGRPTDPDWTERRCVPFKPEIWKGLFRLAKEMSADGRKVSPAQVAAMLVERELAKVG